MPTPVLDPLPQQTPLPRKRRRIHHRQAFFDRVQEAEQKCQLLSGNDVLSCFPTQDDVFSQGQFATFVWNSRLPNYAQTNQVDLYLYHGDSNQQILHVPDVQNPFGQAGNFQYQVNDTWWQGSLGEQWDGQNISRPYYWVVIPSTASLDGSQRTQTHFTAVQTTFADSVVASMSSSSASAASASAASASSASAASASAASASSVSASLTRSPTGTATSTSGTGNLQPGSDDSGFPQWAIAVIVILGFLAIASSCVLAFFITRRVRRRRELESNRNSMGSSSPMMANAANSAGAPLLAAGAATQDHHSSVGHTGTNNLQRAPSVVSPDGASTVSRAGSAGEGGPFSGADAAIMADAFRKALRKPDFTDPPPEEDSPGRDEELLSRELAEEGRDIRSVSSSRGVRVETLSDEGTIQDHSSYHGHH